MKEIRRYVIYESRIRNGILGLITFKAPNYLTLPPAIVGAVSVIATWTPSEKSVVVNSINNGTNGSVDALTRVRSAPGRNYVRANVGFLRYDNLGIQTVSSRNFGYL